MGWSKELEVYKFFLYNKDPKTIEQGILRLEQKQKMSVLVSKIFEMIHQAFAFQENPTEYIKNWIQKMPEGSQKEFEKVLNRLNSIQDSGSFSSAGEFYLKA